MRLSDASVVIRPRSSWEAMDLGVLMAREYRQLLMSSWALVTLPMFALITALLWKYPSTAMFLLWWLKPAFDRLPLYILSKVEAESAGDVDRLPKHQETASFLRGYRRCWVISTATLSNMSPKAWKCCYGVLKRARQSLHSFC